MWVADCHWFFSGWSCFQASHFGLSRGLVSWQSIVHIRAVIPCNAVSSQRAQGIGRSHFGHKLLSHRHIFFFFSEAGSFSICTSSATESVLERGVSCFSSHDPAGTPLVISFVSGLYTLMTSVLLASSGAKYPLFSLERSSGSVACLAAKSSQVWIAHDQRFCFCHRLRTSHLWLLAHITFFG
ncbi:hypothetical protein BSL78_20255 [Apostichopus japonicus]|uniref:Uncharacterized protein n=1 Tax=Stichopus japonicus TaxID=307972 RepID=A0A2G8K4G3_STIJA|nr:hypothetical protein BSL78_20255 [Apostichopus japonicus]